MLAQQYHLPVKFPQFYGIYSGWKSTVALSCHCWNSQSVVLIPNRYSGPAVWLSQAMPDQILTLRNNAPYLLPGFI